MEKQSDIEQEYFDFNVLGKISGISRRIKFYILLVVFTAIVDGGLSNVLAEDKKSEPSPSIPIPLLGGKLRFPDSSDANGILRNFLMKKRWEMMGLYISTAIHD
ncbi:hypothetical protein HZA39_04260 [Candidatus Peregrinibacteria bacterium]|nr:hypothetical protein [Candidatus Peregrinibacteria bacterium]